MIKKNKRKENMGEYSQKFTMLGCYFVNLNSSKKNLSLSAKNH